MRTISAGSTESEVSSGNSLRTQIDNTFAQRLRIDVDPIFSCNTSCKLTDQFDASLLRAQHAFAVGAALESSRRFGVHAKLRAQFV